MYLFQIKAYICLLRYRRSTLHINGPLVFHRLVEYPCYRVHVFVPDPPQQPAVRLAPQVEQELQLSGGRGGGRCGAPGAGAGEEATHKR